MGKKSSKKKIPVIQPTPKAVKVGPLTSQQRPLTIDQMIEGMDNEITLVFEHAKNDSKRVFNNLLDALKGASNQIARIGSENEKLKKLCKDRGIRFEKLLETMDDVPKSMNRKARRAIEKQVKKQKKKNKK